MGLVNSGNRLTDAQNDTVVTANFSTNNFNVIKMDDRTSPRMMSTTTLAGAWLPKIDDNFLYIFNWSSGVLNSYDISNQETPILQSTLSGFSSPYSSFLSGQYLYVGDSFGLRVVDVSNPGRIRLVGSAAAGSGAKYGLAVRGGYAYLTDSSTGALYTFDVRDPANPVLANTLPSFTGPREIAISDKELYLIDISANTFNILDIRNATSPTALSSSVTGISSPAGLAVSGRYAYIGGSTGITVYDVASSTSPTFVKTFGSFSGSNHELVLVGRTLVQTGGTFMHLYDVGGIETNGLTAASAWIGQATIGQSLTVSQDAQVYGGLSVGRGGISTLGRVSAATFDVSKVQMSLATSTYFSTFPTGVFVRNNIAYVADSNFYTLDVSNPASPTLIASLAGVDALDVTVVGDYAYTAAAGGLKVVDISRPTRPVVVGNYANGFGSTKPVISGKYAYMGGTAAFQVVDISNPIAPTSSAVVALTGNAGGIDVQGKFAYVSNDTTFRVYDVTDPANPAATGTLAGFTALGKVFVSGRYAYVGDGVTVRIINISNPTLPVLVATYTTDASLQVNDVSVSGRYLYITKHVEGVEVVDISTPSSPVRVAAYNTPGASFGHHVVGKYMYVADFGNGIAVIDMGGADISSAKIGSVEIGSGQVLNNLDIGGMLAVHGGIVVGSEGLFSQGPIIGASVSISATNFVTSSRTVIGSAFKLVSVNNGVAAVYDGEIITSAQLMYNVSDPTEPMQVSNILAQNDVGEIILKGDYLYQIGTTINAYDVSSPSFPRLVASTTFAAPYTAFMAGQYLYSAIDAGVAIFDVSDPTKITYLDTAPLPNVGIIGSNQRNGLYVREGFAYVTDIGADNFHIVDIRDPFNATSVGFITGFTNPQGVAVENNYAYVVESTSNELNVINITSSTEPFIVRTISSGQAAPSQVALAGNYLFVGGAAGVAVFDVSSSTNPIQLTNLRTGSVNSMQVEGNRLHVGTTAEYIVYEIPSLTAPAMLVGSVQAGTGLIENDFTIGNQLYVGGSLQVGGGIMARGAIAASEISINSFGSASAVRTIVNDVDWVDAEGAYVYGVDDTRIVQVSVSDPVNATVTAWAPVSAGARGIDVVGGYAYVAIGGSGMAIFDVSNASNTMDQVSTTTGLGTTQDIMVSGRYAYIASLTTGVRVVDVGNPYAPVLKETFDGSGTNSTEGVYLQDSYLYLADGDDGLRILDASDPMDLRQVGILNTAGTAENVFVAEGIAYVTDGTNGLVIVNVTNPASPRLMYTIPSIDSGDNTDAIVAGNYLYITATGLGSVNNVNIYDVTSSTRPVLVWGLNTPGSPQGLDVRGGYLYVGDNAAMSIVKLPTFNAPAAEIGSLFAGQLVVAEGLDVGSYINAGTGLSVGQGGIQVQGPSTITGSSTDAILRVRNSANSSTTPFTAWGILADSIAVSPSFNVPPANRDSWSMYIDYSSSSNRGGLCVDDAITGGGCPISNIGGRSIMTDAGITANAFDLAERYSVTGTAEGGDLLVLETSTSTMVTKHSGTMYDPRLIGIVSLNPGFELGWFNPSSTDVAVALTGRVPTKISMNNGPVEIGDPLTSSDVPGYAMKATKPGMIIGHALQSVSATGTAEVFVAVGYWAGSIFNTDGTVALQTDDLTIDAVSIASSTNIAVDSWGLSFRGAAWDEASSTVVTSSFTLLNDVITASSSMFTIQNTSGTSVFSIDEFGKATINGDLSIAGKLYPSARGTVQSEYYIFLDDMLGPTSTYMSTNADGWQSEGSYDLAERYVSEQPLIEGELVTVSSEGGLAIERASGNQKPFMGIVSTKPGFVLGKHSTSTYPVALAGRVPTKVSDANGPIAIGDQLTASADNAGIAVKATGAGYVVGMALEAYPGGDDDLIEVFVQPGWTNGDGSVMPSAPSSGGGSSAPAGVTTVKRGFGDIAAGGTKVTVEFDSIGAYPNIQVTQYAGVEGGWYLNNVTDHGFEIVLNQVQSHDVRFAWRVEPTQAGEQVYYSDNTHGAIDYLTGIGPGTGVGTTSSDPGTDPGSSSGTDPGTDPGSGSSTDPGTDPGSGSSTDPGTP
jgi:hypothetical protein